MSVLVELPPDQYSKTAFDDFAPTSAFNIGTARALIWLSQLAYETAQPATIAAVATTWKLTATAFERTSIAFQKIYDTRGIVASRQDAIIVAFAGTDPVVWENLATNLAIRPNTASNTHSGFAAALDGIWDTVHSAVKTATVPVLFAGHSLGGALAALAAERAHDAGIAPAAVYVFGMPRAGGDVFASRYNAKLGEKTFRLVYGRDVVATVPMSKLGFRHVGRMLACSTDGKFDPSESLSAVGSNDPEFTAGRIQTLKDVASNLLQGRWFMPDGPGPLGPLFRYLPLSIRDHLPDRYWEALTPAMSSPLSQ